MEKVEKNAEVLPDKEVKPETIDTDSKTETTTSTGEYTEEKQAAMGAMKSFYGDEQEINDDNYSSLMEGMVAKDYAPTKELNGKFNEAHKNILAMMEDEPEMSGILSDMRDGGKFLEVLPKYVDLETLSDSKGGDPELWEANNKARMDKYSKIQEHKKAMADNEAKSIETVKSFMANKKLEGENAEAFGEFLAKVIGLANSGNLTEEFLEGMYYAMNYKKDVMEAEQIGRVSEKNAKIEEVMKTEEDLKKGDGTPKIASADDKVSTEEDSDDFADKLDRSFNKKKSPYRA